MASANILAAGIVVAASFDTAFMSLGTIAAIGLTLSWFAMPETGPTAG